MDVKLHALPSRDREFVESAQAACGVLPEPKTTTALQRALRVRYPAAVVTEQTELARHGDGPTVRVLPETWRAGYSPRDA